MKNLTIHPIYKAALLVLPLMMPGCADNIREASATRVAASIEHGQKPDPQGLAWFAPPLYSSQYRTLFFGYDTLEYRLAAANDDPDNFRLVFYANYGGDVRHYDFAKFADKPARGTSHQQHFAERCQLFNSLIASCIYQDRFSLNLSRTELEQAHGTGLKITLSSESKSYEQLELPANYIQGFLSAIGKGHGGG